jgi:hypothetical protein
MVDGELGAPFALAGTASPTPPDGSTDTTVPVLTATPAFNGTTPVVADSRTLTLAADEGTIYYTVDGSAVTTEAGGNVPSPTAKIYQEPIPITAADTKVAVAVIDAAGNATHSSGVVSPKAAAAAVAPTGVQTLGVTGAGPDAATPKGTINVGWTAVPDATEYQVRVWDKTDATNTLRALPQYSTTSTTTNATVSGLPRSADGHRYVVRVQAKTPASDVWGPVSTGVPATAIVPGDDIGLIRAQYRDGEDFRLQGSGTVPNATLTFHRSNVAGTGPVVNALPGFPTVTVGTLDETGTGPWDASMEAPLPANPGTFWIKSSQGDIAGPFTVETR